MKGITLNEIIALDESLDFEFEFIFKQNRFKIANQDQKIPVLKSIS